MVQSHRTTNTLNTARETVGDDVHSFAHSPGQQQPHSDLTASQIALSHHPYPTPQSRVHPFVSLAPYAPLALVERGAVAAEVAAAVEMGTLALVVDKPVDGARSGWAGMI
jgi:hypothetical protein